MTGWHVWTDGSCCHGLREVPAGLPGWGGWCAIVEYGDWGVVLRGRVPRTTNVRMEIHAVVEGLRAVPRGAQVTLHTDSTTILGVRDRLNGRNGPDGRYWRRLEREFDRRDVLVKLIVRREIDPIHRRAHTIAGAEARGGLHDLPRNASPVDDLRWLRQQRRRTLAR